MPGTCVTVTVEGKRPLVAEVQALVAAVDPQPPPGARPAGSTAGRLAMVLAVLQRRAKIKVGAADVYAATVGGVRLTEPATDLAVALAVAGAARQRPAGHRPGRDRRGRAGR